jgi:glycosyltransferase involved in cell wall biosynthesis
MQAPVPLFSVVVPCHDYAHLLERAVASVMRQGWRDFELLIVDDGSTDHTPEVAASLVQSHTEIRYLSQPNRGPAAVRNRAVDESHGRYLVFLDADDELDGDALERVAELVLADPELRVVVAGYTSVSEQGEEERISVPALPADGAERLRWYVEKKISLANGAVFFHRWVFDRIRYPEEFRGSEDIPVFGQALALFPSRSLDLSAARIHRHADSLRHDLAGVESAGLALVDRLFDPRVLPADCMRLREAYFVRRCLSLFRTLYLAGEHTRARTYYLRALRHSPWVVLRLAYLSKFLRSFGG